MTYFIAAGRTAAYSSQSIHPVMYLILGLREPLTIQSTGTQPQSNWGRPYESYFSIPLHSGRKPSQSKVDMFNCKSIEGKLIIA